jgi:hypothetical protein
MNNYPLIKLMFCLLIIIIIIVGYYFIPVNVKLTKIAEAATEKKFDKARWNLVTKESSPAIAQIYLNNYNVILPDINYDENNLIISVGREIVSLKYRRFSRFQMPYSSKPYVGVVVFSKEMNPQTIYFYEIKRVKVIYDDIGWPEVEIEK